MWLGLTINQVKTIHIMKSLNIVTKSVFAAAVAGVLAFAPVSQAGTESYKTPAPMLEAEENWWSAELSAGYDSKYMFRGVEQFGGSGIVWTDLSFSAAGFTLGAWYADATDSFENEVDVYASYAWALGPIDIEGGYIYYHYPSGADVDYHELFVSLSTDLGYVTPSLTYYQDVKDFDFDYGYLEFALSSSFPIVEGVVSLDPYALVSSSFDYANGSDARWNHFQAGLEVPIAMSENITLTGYGAVSVPLDSAVNGDEEEFWGGAYITFSF